MISQIQSTGFKVSVEEILYIKLGLELNLKYKKEKKRKEKKEIMAVQGTTKQSNIRL